MSDPHPLAQLSARQREIVLLRIEGLTTTAIASRLFLGLKTVETHSMQARERLGIEAGAPGSAGWLLPLARAVGAWEERHGEGATG